MRCAKSDRFVLHVPVRIISLLQITTKHIALSSTIRKPQSFIIKYGAIILGSDLELAAESDHAGLGFKVADLPCPPVLTFLSFSSFLHHEAVPEAIHLGPNLRATFARIA